MAPCLLQGTRIKKPAIAAGATVVAQTALGQDAKTKVPFAFVFGDARPFLGAKRGAATENIADTTDGGQQQHVGPKSRTTCGREVEEGVLVLSSSSRRLRRVRRTRARLPICSFINVLNFHVDCRGHPCQRCASLGQAANCHFLPARKRGRPPKGTIQFDSPTAPAAAPTPSWTTSFSYEPTPTASLSTTSSQSLNAPGPGRGKRQRSERTHTLRGTAYLPSSCAQ
jgi:hypothetical protein